MSAREPIRGYADWSPRAKTLAVVEQVLAVLDEYAAHLPLTTRQVFYRRRTWTRTFSPTTACWRTRTASPCYTRCPAARTTTRTSSERRSSP